jgi:hypothetical protein
VVIGEVTSNNPQTAADRHNAAILRQALLDDGPGGHDNDADPEVYGPMPAPSESASEWQLIDTQIKCNRIEEGHQPIRPGILRLQSTLGTSNLLTFFLAFLSARHLEDCLEDMNEYVASNGIKDCPLFTIGELFIFMGVIVAMSNFHGVKTESLWDKEGFPKVKRLVQRLSSPR